MFKFQKSQYIVLFSVNLKMNLKMNFRNEFKIWIMNKYAGSCFNFIDRQKCEFSNFSYFFEKWSDWFGLFLGFFKFPFENV